MDDYYAIRFGQDFKPEEIYVNSKEIKRMFRPSPDLSCISITEVSKFLGCSKDDAVTELLYGNPKLLNHVSSLDSWDYFIVWNESILSKNPSLKIRHTPTQDNPFHYSLTNGTWKAVTAGKAHPPTNFFNLKAIDTMYTLIIENCEYYSNNFPKK